jgi:hypothetical protein
MKKIADLHAFILSLDLFAAEQLDSYIDDLTVTPSWRNGPQPSTKIAAVMDYTATYFIERYPHHAVPAELLIAQISAWLLTHDADNLNPFTYGVNVDVLDASTADLEFGIGFSEDVVVIEDLSGPIEMDGTRYRLLT